MGFRPVEDKILVKRTVEKTTRTGIIIPETTKDKPLEGTVIAVSNEVTGIEVGETIVFGKFSGSDITLADGDFLLLAKRDISGIIDPD